MADTDRDLDIAQLTAAVAKADALAAHYRTGLGLVSDLKRTLVVRLIHKQFGSLSVHDETKLLAQYGVGTERKTDR